MKLLVLILCALCAAAQVDTGPRVYVGLQDASGAALRPPSTTAANLPPAADSTGQVFIVTDAAGPASCSGGGSHRTLCVSNGTAWNPVSGDGKGVETVQDEGTNLTQRPTMNFTGTVIACSDDAGNNRTNCSVSGDGKGVETIQDEGTNLTQRPTLNFTGTVVTCSDNDGSNRTDCSVSGDGRGVETIQDEGTNLTQRPTVNFIGTGVTCVDNSGANRTDCTISGDGGKSVMSLSWFFPGVVVAGVQSARALVPEGVTGCSSTNSRITVGTTSGSASTWNIQRCTGGAGNCSSTANIYSSDITLSANTQSVAGGTPTTTTVSAGDAFRVNLVTVGAGLADVTVTLTYKCDTTT